jgi:endonuclease III-like uncharacterized protein
MPAEQRLKHGRPSRRPEPPPGSPLRRRLLRLYAALRHRFGHPGRERARPARRLAALLRPAARRHQGDLRRFLRQSLPALRTELLAIPGIGPGTADAILLSVAGRPVFVVGAETRRVLTRHRLVPPRTPSATVQRLLMEDLPRDPALFNEYHALLVRVAKEYCRASVALCAECPLRFDLRGRPPRL